MACHSGSSNPASQSCVLNSNYALLTIRNYCLIYPRRTQPPLKTMIHPLRCIRLEIEIPFDELEVLPDVLERPGIAEELLKVSKVLTNVADEVDDGVVDGAAAEAASAGIPMQSTRAAELRMQESAENAYHTSF